MPDQVLDKRRDLLAGFQRQQIVEAFCALASEKTYQATTISEIASRAHVSKATFYVHFADKEAVYLHLHSLVAEEVAENFELSLGRTADEPDWRLRVRDFVGARIDASTSSDSHLAQIAIEAQVATEAARRVRLEAAERSLGYCLRLAEEISKTTDEVDPVEDHIAYAGLAANVAFIAATAPQGRDAVQALLDPLTEIWIRLLRS